MTDDDNRDDESQMRCEFCGETGSEHWYDQHIGNVPEGCANTYDNDDELELAASSDSSENPDGFSLDIAAVIRSSEVVFNEEILPDPMGGAGHLSIWTEDIEVGKSPAEVALVRANQPIGIVLELLEEEFGFRRPYFVCNNDDCVISTHNVTRKQNDEGELEWDEMERCTSCGEPLKRKEKLIVEDWQDVRERLRSHLDEEVADQ